MKTLILFDIDGTILLTGGAGFRSIDKVMKELFDLEKASQGIPFVGRTDKGIFSEIVENKLKRPVDAALNEKIRKEYIRFMREEIPASSGFQVLPGVRTIVETLAQDERFSLGIATGNIEEGAWIKLEQAGLKEYFSFGGFDEDGVKRSEIVASAIEKAKTCHPEGFSRIFLVGDYPYDFQAAKEVGVIYIAVG